MSNIRITGNIGLEPEMRFTPQGKEVLSFSVALYTGGTKENGYKDTYWVRCTAWEELAVKLSNDLKKGMKVTVAGQAQPPRTYEKDGQQVKAGLEVTVYEVFEGDTFRDAAPELVDDIPF